MSNTPPPLPPDYDERVYAGVLGKLVGVYLGRPFEQWSHERIAARWGVIDRYVHEDFGLPLVVTDDDITGTFTFVRALLDHDSGAAITSREIGRTWLNYIAEGRHILWWGGMGMSTEHTAFIRLKGGVEAPRSGSIELNGKAVAEEIGAQIFIDGWALVSPGRPGQAARLAREAARVSHDGEAVHGAVFVAVMESLAFVEPDLDRLLDAGLGHVPPDSEVAQAVADLRLWHREDRDWRLTLSRLRDKWGYARYGTNCPLVSNLAVIVLALLYGGGDFDRSMLIVNTAGYDTDCNSGNLGCLLGIRGGLAALRSGRDWRTPVNDRLLLPAADGHWGLMDASRLASIIAGLGRRLAEGKPGAGLPTTAGAGPRYTFPFPGSTHGFAASELCPAAVTTEPVPGGLRLRVLAPGLRCDAEVRTFLTPQLLKLGGYGACATPALYPGQTLRARVEAGATPVRARLFVRAYRDNDSLALHEGPVAELAAGEARELTWTVPAVGDLPVATAGLSLEGDEGAQLALRSFTWDGLAPLVIKRPAGSNEWWGPPGIWSRAFIHQVDSFQGDERTPFALGQNHGRGLVHTGAEDWRDYEASVEITPMLASECGLAIRVRGLTCHLALVLRAGNRLALVRRRHDETVLAETGFAWEPRRPVRLALAAQGGRLRARVDDREVFAIDDPLPGLESGGVGLVVADGRVVAGPLVLTPLPRPAA